MYPARRTCAHPEISCDTFDLISDEHRGARRGLGQHDAEILGMELAAEYLCSVECSPLHVAGQHAVDATRFSTQIPRQVHQPPLTPSRLGPSLPSAMLGLASPSRKSFNEDIGLFFGECGSKKQQALYRVWRDIFGKIIGAAHADHDPDRKIRNRSSPPLPGTANASPLQSCSSSQVKSTARHL